MLYHCFASFKQSLIDFFKLVDSRLILMLLYDSLSLIISEVHQSHLDGNIGQLSCLLGCTYTTSGLKLLLLYL